MITAESSRPFHIKGRPLCFDKNPDKYLDKDLDKKLDRKLGRKLDRKNEQ